MVLVLVFCATNATILLVYTAVKIKMSIIWKDDFFLPKSAPSVSRSQAHLEKRKCIGWSIDFNSWTNWTLYGVIPRSLYEIHLYDVSEMFNYWERRWIDVDGVSHTLSNTAAIFSSVRTVFGFSRFGLSISFFHYFHKITTIRSWRHFSSSKIRMQFSHTFCNNITQRCSTQPYSFGGRIKLIICQIRHELSVTIHEISTSWKKKNVR